ncbi:uncharacterized protein LOC143373960 [Andrena cerasifolii]|uniref:uncharacterized protein LOC143373960 n=1 Tax=Andrena cerasifolii TaxID=2819439 RepID=UPI0040377266
MVTAVIKKCEPASTSWPKHPVKLLTRVTFDTYLKAREKTELAEDTSDLKSDEPPSMRRRIIPKAFWSSEDSDNEVQRSDKSAENIQSSLVVEEYFEKQLNDQKEDLDCQEEY